MAQNYTKMWDAFLGGEWTQGEPLTETAESQDYLDQTKAFYSNVLDPAFDIPGFGETDLAGAYAQFSNVDLERAERTFRSEIGDPYGGGVGDPFSWEKVSRYNTEAGGYDRIQDLLEDQLYGQGKFLGGQTGADYGTATAKELETYTTGLRGEREALTYEGLTGGAGLTSGTGGSVLRSGESASVAEDVLIEAYKKAKTLGSDYRAGSEDIEQTLSEDLDTALTTYLKAIDDEKSRWFSSVMSNVNTFKRLEMEANLTDEQKEAGVTYETLTDEQLEDLMNEGFEGMPGTGYYDQWGCGYGQEPDPDNPGECIDTEAYGGKEGEVAGYGFRDDEVGACGIGMIFEDGKCVPAFEGLVPDNYGLLCQPKDIDECGVCDGDNSSCEDECGVPYGDGTTCGEADDSTEPSIVEDECGVVNGPGKIPCSTTNQYECPDDCPETIKDPVGTLICDPGFGYNEDTNECEKIEDYNPCPDGEEENSYGQCVPVDCNYVHCPNGDWACEGFCIDDDFFDDQEELEDDDCFCDCVTYKGGSGGGKAGATTICLWNCPGMLKDGEECGRDKPDPGGKPFAGA